MIILNAKFLQLQKVNLKDVNHLNDRTIFVTNYVKTIIHNQSPML
jgi:hypothetical protein